MKASLRFSANAHPNSAVIETVSVAGCGKTNFFMKVFPHPGIKLASFLFDSHLADSLARFAFRLLVGCNIEIGIAGKSLPLTRGRLGGGRPASFRYDTPISFSTLQATSV